MFFSSSMQQALHMDAMLHTQLFIMEVFNNLLM